MIFLDELNSKAALHLSFKIYIYIAVGQWNWNTSLY